MLVTTVKLQIYLYRGAQDRRKGYVNTFNLGEDNQKYE